MLSEQQELNSELQELYLVGKQWLSDIAFVQDELLIMKDQSATIVWETPEGERSEQKAAIEEGARELMRTAFTLEKEIIRHDHQLEKLVTNAAIQVGIELIEHHGELENRLKDFMLDLKEYRAMVLGAAKTHLSGGKGTYGRGFMGGHPMPLAMHPQN